MEYTIHVLLISNTFEMHNVDFERSIFVGNSTRHVQMLDYEKSVKVNRLRRN